MMILLIAFVLGFGIPFAIFYLMKMLDTSVKTRSDLGKADRPVPGRDPADGPDRELLEATPGRPLRPQETPIMVQSGKRDMINEAFRVLRTNLDLMIPQGGRDIGHHGDLLQPECR